MRIENSEEMFRLGNKEQQHNSEEKTCQEIVYSFCSERHKICNNKKCVNLFKMHFKLMIFENVPQYQDTEDSSFWKLWALQLHTNIMFLEN